MSPLSRSSLRRGITAAALTGALVLLSSCGSSGSSADAGPAQTRTVTTAEGPVEVPVDPQRIVVLNYALAGYLYDLDEPVVATTPEVTNTDGEYSEFWDEKAEAQGTEFLPWSNDGFDLEAVIASDPDLIIAGGLGFPGKHAADSYDRLQEIAPTVIVSGDRQTWQDQFAFIAGDVLGRQDDYDGFVRDYEKRVAEVRESIEVPAGEVSFLTLDKPESPYILIEGKSLSAELAPLGFTTAPLFERNDIDPYVAGGDMFGPSLETLPDVLDADTVFVVGFNSPKMTVAALEDRAPYDRVPAFETGQVYDQPYWALRADYDESRALLDLIEDMFAKA